jgi:hypothetical protein
VVIVARISRQLCERPCGVSRREMDRVTDRGSVSLRHGTAIPLANSLRGTPDRNPASSPHLSLGTDAPDTREVQPPGRGTIAGFPEVGGLHHRHTRRAA